MTAVAYINNQEGTVSQELVHLTRDLWMWCLERNIHIHAETPPRPSEHGRRQGIEVDERLAGLETRCGDFQRIDQTFGPLKVDLFASRLTHQCRRYFSWQPDPFAEVTDAFTQDWSTMNWFANPPWNLIAKVPAKTQTQGASIVLIAPV